MQRKRIVLACIATGVVFLSSTASAESLNLNVNSIEIGEKCSDHQKDEIQNALRIVGHVLEEVDDYVVPYSHYEYWFGSFAEPVPVEREDFPPRLRDGDPNDPVVLSDVVKLVFEGIKDDWQGGRIEIDCVDEDECGVLTNSCGRRASTCTDTYTCDGLGSPDPTLINLTPAWFDKEKIPLLTLEGDANQVGILVHEMSHCAHYDDGDGHDLTSDPLHSGCDDECDSTADPAGDKCGGYDNARFLAEEDPAVAVRNGENYEHFAASVFVSDTGDWDLDGVAWEDDNCPEVFNPDQMPCTAPVGWLDSVQHGRVYGWACDPDQPWVPIAVHLYFGGPAGEGFGVAAMADEPSEFGVYAACGGGWAHRFSAPIPDDSGAALLPGNGLVYAYGIDTFGYANSHLAGSPAALSPPIGWLDGVTETTVWGWACDPDVPERSIPVHLYFGGPASEGHGIPVMAEHSSEQAVSAACGGGQAHRFSIQIPQDAMAARVQGNGMVYAYGIDLFGNSDNSELSGSPRGCSIPRWEPERWTSENIVKSNNCYNYANDKITNTNAQPGRASGVLSRGPGFEGFRDAAVSDGLVYVGENLPSNPYDCGDGHLVFMATNSGGDDFHWWRLDQGGGWSHKPGELAPTRREWEDDQNSMFDEPTGDTISNPLTSGRGKYTGPGGFFCTCGHNANIE